MLHGEKITIRRPSQTETDSYGDPIVSWSEEIVDDVLIADGAQANSVAALQPTHVTVSRTLYFPRSWTYQSLKGCLIRLDDVEYTVIGDPRPYQGGVKPTKWDLVVQVTDERS